MLNWLKHAAIRTVLAELADGRRPLSHAALDDLPPGKPIEHLRTVLVATSALPARDSRSPASSAGSARLSASTPTRKTKNCCTATRPGTCCDGSGSATAAPRPPMASSTPSGNGCAPLSACSAGCASAGSPWPLLSKPTWTPGWPARTATRKGGEAGHFVRWTISHGINRQPAVRRHPVDAAPPRPLNQDEARWRKPVAAARPHPQAGNRVAGCCPALRPAARGDQPPHPRRPRHQRRQVNSGSGPSLLLPEPLAALTRRPGRHPAGPRRLGDQGTSRWLFPGGRPGRPVSSDRLGERLRRLGLQPGQARSTALFQLATELPAAVLARLLGIHIKVAVAWQQPPPETGPATPPTSAVAWNTDQMPALPELDIARVRRWCENVSPSTSGTRSVSSTTSRPSS